MKNLTVPADLDHLDEVTAFVDEELEAHQCPPRSQAQIEMVIDEIFSNIAFYAYRPATGEAEVRCEVLENPLRVELQFLDGGIPYDPLQREDPDTSLDAIIARDGGFGIMLVKNTMDEVHYAYENGKNILTVRKNLTSEEE